MFKLDKGTKILIAVNTSLILLIVGLYFVLFPEPKSESKTAQVETPPTEVATEVKPPEIPDVAPDREEMQNMIKYVLGSDLQKFAVFVFRPKMEKQPLIFQSRPMPPASMIKMFVLAKGMQDVKDGKMSLDELITITPQNIVGGAGIIAGEGAGAKVPVRKAMELMITESDNTATNILIDRIGGLEPINEYLKANGYNDTIFTHKMMLQRGQSNYSSVADLGLLFTRIYDHNCVDDYYDQIMIDYLLKQADLDCFPAALPYWNIAHKTGEVEKLYDDGGILYGAAGDFILVIMDENYTDRGGTIDKMKSIAILIADKFMPPNH